MTYSNKTCFFTALLALSVSACGGAADRDHDHEAGHEDASSASPPMMKAEKLTIADLVI